MENSVDIFISYAHGDESSPEGKKRQEVLNLIQEAAEKKPFINKLYIDINAINFKDNIQAFAKEIAKAQFIIIILSDKYLKSQWCMQEVSLILESPDFQDRIFPVVLEDAKVNSAEGRAEYTIYWQDKVDKLDEQIKRIRDITQCAPLIEDLKVYKSILKAVSTFTNTIGLMKVLNAESHMKTSFESLFEAIGEQQKTLRSKIDLVKVSEENKK